MPKECPLGCECAKCKIYAAQQSVTLKQLPGGGLNEVMMGDAAKAAPPSITEQIADLVKGVEDISKQLNDLKELNERNRSVTQDMKRIIGI